MALQETLRQGAVNEVNVPYAGTVFTIEKPTVAEDATGLTKAQKYLLRERSRAVIDGAVRVSTPDSLSRRTIKTRFGSHEESKFHLGVAHNAVISSRINNPGGLEHTQAIQNLTEILANGPKTLIRILQNEKGRFDK